jgi:membrane-associated phospholipid phosphatase
MRLTPRSRYLLAAALAWTVSVAPARAQPPGALPPFEPSATLAPPPAGSSDADSGLERERIPFSGLFRDLVTDVKHLPSRENLWIVGLGAGLALAAHPADTRVTHSASSSSAADATFDSGQMIGGGMLQIGAAVGAYAIGRVGGNTRLAMVGRDLVRAQVLDAILTQGIKFAVQRQRPDGSSYSFPSGHASTAFTTATVLQRYYGWKVGAPAFGLAAYVGANRLTENRHYLSDVAFGAAIGVLAGRTSTLHLGGSRFVLGPAIGPNGGVGVSFTRIPTATPAP